MNDETTPSATIKKSDLSDYRNKPSEKLRVADLMRLIPKGIRSVLDVGARDGHLSLELTAHCDAVTALDLEMPLVDHPQVTCIKGDATKLSFEANTFDLVFCAEVLEHIPSPHLENACLEISRVASRYVLIGVPYKQDTRNGRMTCLSCGRKNPPWGHVNQFDEIRLQQLFPNLSVAEVSFVGEAEMRTNWLSAYLMDAAGNPYGTYEQDEPCIHCGERMRRPPSRTLLQRLATKAAHLTRRLQAVVHRPHGNWIHVLLAKP